MGSHLLIANSGKKDKRCENNGQNSIRCSPPEKAEKTCKDKYEVPEKEKNDRTGERKFNCDTKKCECELPKKWNEGKSKCEYPELQEVSFKRLHSC